VQPAETGQGSGVEYFTRAAAGLGFVNSPAIEVAATALSIRILGPVKKTDVYDEAGQITGTRVDTVFWGLKVLNRAAVSFDSVQALATEYLTSLQATPLTLRGEIPFVLAVRDVSIPIVLRLDGRGVPYADSVGTVKFGAAGHLFVSTSLTQPAWQGTDRGHVYAEPTLYVTIGGKELFQSVLASDEGQSFFGGEIRAGYRSLLSRHLDIGLVGRCAFATLAGSTCRISVIGSATP
jgi:hypothetical protein